MRKEKLSKYDIEMLKGLMSNELILLRVFPYESATRDVIIATNYHRVEMQKNSILYKRLIEIRRIAEKYNLSDNKIVIQVGLPYHNNSLFLGYWDDTYSVGYAVQPCRYAPKEFPRSIGSWVGMLYRFKL